MAIYLMIGIATVLYICMTLLLNLAEDFTIVTIIYAILRTCLGACTSIFAVGTVLSKKKICLIPLKEFYFKTNIFKTLNMWAPINECLRPIV